MEQEVEQIAIKISTEFTRTPGARNVDEGSFSGECFLNTILIKKFEEAVRENTSLLVDLDDTEGYATSFLEEAFGGLARRFGHKKVLSVLEFKSDDEPLLIEEIQTYIKEANR